MQGQQRVDEGGRAVRSRARATASSATGGARARLAVIQEWSASGPGGRHAGALRGRPVADGCWLVEQGDLLVSGRTGRDAEGVDADRGPGPAGVSPGRRASASRLAIGGGRLGQPAGRELRVGQVRDQSEPGDGIGGGARPVRAGRARGGRGRRRNRGGRRTRGRPDARSERLARGRRPRRSGRPVRRCGSPAEVGQRPADGQVRRPLCGAGEPPSIISRNRSWTKGARGRQGR